MICGDSQNGLGGGGGGASALCLEDRGATGAGTNCGTTRPLCNANVASGPLAGWGTPTGPAGRVLAISAGGGGGGYDASGECPTSGLTGGDGGPLGIGFGSSSAAGGTYIPGETANANSAGDAAGSTTAQDNSFLMTGTFGIPVVSGGGGSGLSGGLGGSSSALCGGGGASSW